VRNKTGSVVFTACAPTPGLVRRTAVKHLIVGNVIKKPINQMTFDFFYNGLDMNKRIKNFSISTSMNMLEATATIICQVCESISTVPNNSCMGSQ
jgi:hypothetical protein